MVHQIVVQFQNLRVQVRYRAGMVVEVNSKNITGYCHSAVKTVLVSLFGEFSFRVVFDYNGRW